MKNCLENNDEVFSSNLIARLEKQIPRHGLHWLDRLLEFQKPFTKLKEDSASPLCRKWTKAAGFAWFDQSPGNPGWVGWYPSDFDYSGHSSRRNGGALHDARPWCPWLAGYEARALFPSLEHRSLSSRGAWCSHTAKDFKYGDILTRRCLKWHTKKLSQQLISLNNWWKVL